MPDNEVTVTIPLRLFLQVLWGFKFTGSLGDYRERAYPGDEIISLLEKQVPPEIADRYYKIVRPQPSVEAVLWHANEWRTSGQREAEKKQESETFSKRADALTAWLIQKVPMLALNGKQFVRNLSFVIVKDGNYASLKAFGMTEEQIELIKKGDYATPS